MHSDAAEGVINDGKLRNEVTTALLFYVHVVCVPLSRVSWYMVSEVSNKNSVFIFRVKQPNKILLPDLEEEGCPIL